MITDLNRINSELREKNLEIRESKKRYRQLVETMNEGIAVVDDNGIFTYLNQKFCDMLGYTKNEMIGQDIKSFFRDEYVEMFKKEFIKRKKGDSSTYEVEWQRKNGEKVPAIISPVPIFDEYGKFKGSFGVITDLREIRQMETRLNHALKMEAIGTLAEVLHMISIICLPES